VRLDDFPSSDLIDFLGEEDGASFIEMALVASLIAVVFFIAVLAIGKRT
jgi:Flp pilus assembly pilin Flp